MKISPIHKGRGVWTPMELLSSFRNCQHFASLVLSTVPFIHSFIYFIHLLLFFAEILKSKSPASYYLKKIQDLSVIDKDVKKHHNYRTMIIQSLSLVRLFATPWTAACQASLSITNSWRLLELMSIGLMMPSKYLILGCPLFFLSSIFPSTRIFSNESVLLIRWPKYWSFSFSISPSSEYSGVISFRMDWLDLLAVQGTLKSHLQMNHSSFWTTVQKHRFFGAQLSSYLTKLTIIS